MLRTILVTLMFLIGCSAKTVVVHDPITKSKNETTLDEAIGTAVVVNTEIGPMLRAFYAAKGIVPESLADLENFAGEIQNPTDFKRFCDISITPEGNRASVSVRYNYPYRIGNRVYGEGRKGCSQPVSWVTALTEEQHTEDREKFLYQSGSEEDAEKRVEERLKELFRR